MCTVILRWEPNSTVEILALRDEVIGRDFDDPGHWWSEQPDALGGRDRMAGGTWCVTSTRTGTTALVLNRPQKRTGAPTRGLLPLLALAHGADWPSLIEVSGMASFSLLLAERTELTFWAFNGQELTTESLVAGTHMVTSNGESDGKAAQHLAAFERASFERWPDLVAAAEPQDDPTALVVRHERGEAHFGTVFGQLIRASRSDVTLSWSRTPWLRGTWETPTAS